MQNSNRCFHDCSMWCKCATTKWTKHTGLPRASKTKQTATTTSRWLSQGYAQTHTHTHNKRASGIPKNVSSLAKRACCAAAAAAAHKTQNCCVFNTHSRMFLAHRGEHANATTMTVTDLVCVVRFSVQNVQRLSRWRAWVELSCRIVYGIVYTRTHNTDHSHPHHKIDDDDSYNPLFCLSFFSYALSIFYSIISAWYW